MPDSLSELSTWSMDWAWGLPLVVGTLMVHLGALRWIERAALGGAAGRHGDHVVVRGAVVGLVVLLVTALLAAEAAAWALAYVATGALGNFHDAMLYSLGALTSYGHAPLLLARPWQMMVAIEALNGMMLFGITTAHLLRGLRLGGA